MLSEGVKVYFSEGINPSERLSISEGVELMESDDYLPESYVPKEDFRQITNKELILLEGKDNAENFAENLAILKLPDSFKTVVDNLKMESATSQIELHTMIGRHKELSKQLNIELNNFIEPYLTSIKHKKVFGIFLLPTNIRTVGRQESLKKHMGLHLDSGTSLPIQEYHHAPNRVCINIGKSTRYLLIINKTAKQLLAMIAEKMDIAHIKSQEDIMKAFFKNYPDYPVIKIALNPFEAYIAPTDNVIHDGTTVGMTSPDITIVLFGFFNLRPNIN
jgi:hypothetical protein